MKVLRDMGEMVIMTTIAALLLGLTFLAPLLIIIRENPIRVMCSRHKQDADKEDEALRTAASPQVLDGVPVILSAPATSRPRSPIKLSRPAACPRGSSPISTAAPQATVGDEDEAWQLPPPLYSAASPQVRSLDSIQECNERNEVAPDSELLEERKPLTPTRKKGRIQDCDERYEDDDAPESELRCTARTAQSPRHLHVGDVVSS